MAAPRLAKLLTSTYACRLNAQLVYPSQQQVVKPNELESALARPMQVAFYEPHQSVRYLAATLSYGIIKGHPFLDGNKRTAFLLGNAFLRAWGLPGLVDCAVVYADIITTAERYIAVAAGQLDVEGLANE